MVHKEKRLMFATEMLSKWGRTVKADRMWGRLVNSDFSAKIRIFSATNTKNDIVWSWSRRRYVGSRSRKSSQQDWE